MRLSHLSLVDFRSYAGLELELEPGVCVLVGPNGHGKTNVVEAVGYLATHGSHRVAQDQPLVRIGAQRAVIRAAVHHEDRSVLLELEINPGRANRARVNRNAVGKTRDALGYLRTVLFAPEDLALVKGDPAVRRQFLDELLVARTPRFAAVRADYERALKQRNALLRSAAQLRRANRGAAVDMTTLDLWDGHLASAGAHLLAARLELVESLNPLVGKAYGTIAGRDTALLDYKPSFELSTGGGSPVDESAVHDALIAALNAGRKDEIERGMTLVGPHRDELALLLDHGHGPVPAKAYASHGESWSFALSAKLAAFELLRAEAIEPVLILDDVFAELDNSRRGQLAQVAASAEQVLITAAVEEDVPASLSGMRYRIGKGTAERLR
ncbi:DNA replication/repair protein RecF [Actinospica sp. MGRD01-02]|uniref:DNA replication and repair protein RecF n=1 Tax=Actinospica acidithermotolerans TaxID=2828514 RepID=A0A941E6F6_9ACTN|nr:DNA replication/repair protein RecF [Actinospica acidithermotolerans]MBR7824808.1 DNA replication/repair protein RecF [Actinospica acidithermotolerans]